MRRTRGFTIKRKLVSVFKCFHGTMQKEAGYRSKVMARIYGWGCYMKRRAKGLCSFGSVSGYIPMGQELFDTKPVTAPKGQLAVYVGEKEDDPHRFLVPVIYCNHPLFGSLLREAEEKYGFHHPGGITIPCQISEFESVQTRIAAGQRHRKLTWERSY